MFGDTRVVFSSDIRHQLTNSMADLMHAITKERELVEVDSLMASEELFNVLWAEVERAVAIGVMFFDHDRAQVDEDDFLPPQKVDVMVDLEPGETTTPTRW